MAYKLLLTESAGSDLDGILAHLTGELRSPAAASELLVAIEVVYQHLEESPFLYALCRQKLLAAYGYRKVPIRGYLMIYRVDEARLIVYIELFFSELEDFESEL